VLQQGLPHLRRSVPPPPQPLTLAAHHHSRWQRTRWLEERRRKQHDYRVREAQRQALLDAANAKVWGVGCGVWVVRRGPHALLVFACPCKGVCADAFSRSHVWCGCGCGCVRCGCVRCGCVRWYAPQRERLKRDEANRRRIQAVLADGDWD